MCPVSSGLRSRARPQSSRSSTHSDTSPPPTTTTTATTCTTSSSSPLKRRRVNEAPLPQLFLDSDDEKDEEIDAEMLKILESEEFTEENIFKLDPVPGRAIYNRVVRPPTFICPFSVERDNPCVNFAAPRKRKIQIANHLRNVQDKPDEQHPADDALWNTPLVRNYYLVTRPTYTPEQQIQASKESNRNHYERRKAREHKWIEPLTHGFKVGKVQPDWMRRMLVGKNRIDFEIQATVAEKMHQKLEARIQNLRRETNPNNELIKDLESKRIELEQSQKTQQRFREQAVNISRQFAGLFGHSKDDTLLSSSHLDILSYAGILHPTDISPEAFYFYAAYVTPQLDWIRMTPWKEDSMRDIKATFTRQCRSWTQVFKGDSPASMSGRKSIEDRLQVFNSSCDLVSVGREEGGMYNDIEAEAWEKSQGELWKAAQDTVLKAVFQDSFTGVDNSPAALVTTVQNVCKLVRGVDLAEQ